MSKDNVFKPGSTKNVEVYSFKDSYIKNVIEELLPFIFDHALKLDKNTVLQIKLDILHNDELQGELRTLKELFEASYGPTGR